MGEVFMGNKSLKVGDILWASCGYEQRNIDYYQVTALIGSTMAEITSIKNETVENLGYCVAKVKPVKNDFIGDPMRIKVKGDKTPYAKVRSFAVAYLWDGQPKTETSYY